MGSRTWWNVWYAGIFALLPFAACAADGGAKPVVHVGVVERPDLAPFVLALYGGHFAEQGLDVQPVVGTSGQDFVSALATSQMQVASGVPNAGLYNALNRGINIRLVADYAHVGPKPEDSTVSIIMRADLIDSGAVKTPADLKGRVIAAGPSPGQYPQILLSKVLERGNLKISDVSVRYLPFPEALAALGSKTIDGSFMMEPLTTQGRRKNIARVLMPAGAVDPGAELSIVLYSPEFATNTDVATRYMVGFLEGVRDYQDAFFLKKHRDATIAILTQHTILKDPKAWMEAIPQNTDPNGHINVADLRRQAIFYKAQGTLSGEVPDLAKFVDPRFAEAAVKKIGVRK
ncbi:MAG TPA: ABC transporter substrate-binding protein [Stellaceae bacterium]|nr:ABC transporter substrate-binding protein [Stellaceae bacterium]